MKKLIILTAMVLMSLSAFAQSDEKNDDEIYVYGQILRKSYMEDSRSPEITIVSFGKLNNCFSDRDNVSMASRLASMCDVLNELAIMNWKFESSYVEITNDYKVTVWLIKKKLKYFSPNEQTKIRTALSH